MRIPYALLILVAPCLMALQCGEAPESRCVLLDADGDGADTFECGGDDCDDADPTRYPGAAEICDALAHDEDCNPTTFGFRDADGDQFLDARCCNLDDSEYVCGDDCDDASASTHPTQNEVCNELDDDCDAAIDEAVTVDLYIDFDEDGHGSGEPMEGCSLYPGVSYLDNDCDDKNAAIVPGSQRCASGSTYQICENAVWASAMTCGSQTVCRAQPNGTGICF